MHQGKQLNSKYQAQQIEYQNEVSQTSQPIEIVPGERFYKDTLITQKKNTVIFQGELICDF